MADTQPYRPKKRGYETAGDMLRSLLPIVILVLIFAAFCVPRGSKQESRVDPAIDIRSAAQTVDFEVLAPSGLSESWVPTSSKLLREGESPQADPNGLSIGYVTPSEEFARFTIAQGLRSEVIEASIGTDDDVTADPSGDPVELDGREWVPFTAGGNTGYVNVTGSGEQAVVIVVFGGAESGELLELAGSLEVAKG